MNVPVSMIILSLVVIFLMMFLVVGLNETLPAFIRSDFDVICTRYLNLLVTQGGLTNSDIANLRNELSNINLTNIDIQIYLDGNPSNPAPSIIDWGREATLKIEAIYEYENVSISTNPTKQNKTHTIKYENSSVILSLD